MSNSLSFDQEQLHSYVDDLLTPEARRRVEAYLEEHPDARVQVEQYRTLNEQLKLLYGSVAEEPIPERLITTRPPRDWWRPLKSAAAALLLLWIGGLLGWWIAHDRLAITGVTATPAAVVREAAMAYAVYAPEVKHPVEVEAAQEQHLVAWLTKRLDSPVRAPDLTDLGFRLIGGRLLSSADGPGALLMYEDETGRRIVLYACQSHPAERISAFRFAEHEGISVFYWVDAPLSYALAGDLNKSSLMAIAQAVYRQLVI